MTNEDELLRMLLVSNLSKNDKTKQIHNENRPRLFLLDEVQVLSKKLTLKEPLLLSQEFTNLDIVN